MPAARAMLQRKCGCGQRTAEVGGCEECSKEEKSKQLQRSITREESVKELSPLVHEVLRSSGKRLDESNRAFFETGFSHDFSQVRVHTDAKAAESAAAVNALAYTMGHQVVFGSGQYVPQTGEGRKLIAHELTHVIQQKGPRGNGNSPFGLQRQAAPAVRRPPFDDQPEDLRRSLEASFAAGKFGCKGGVDATSCFNRLDSSARLVLISLYNRFTRFGLWDLVLYVGGIWTSGVGGAHFNVRDSKAFFSSLLAGAQFCMDTAAGGILHRGATSMREISTGDSLHLSLTGNTVSAHIDAISPAAGRETGGSCRYDPTAAAAHIGREVVPLAIPGLKIFPEPRPTFGLPEQGAPAPEIIGLELFRF
jgi:uncharacterized protein DUF4157